MYRIYDIALWQEAETKFTEKDETVEWQSHSRATFNCQFA